MSERYCSCPKVLNSHALPLFEYPIKPLGSITYLLEFGRVTHSPSKAYKELPKSFCDNIVNHETKDFLKNTYSMFTY
jgi:hypothetical protein